MAKKGRKYIPQQHRYKNPLPVHPLDLPELILNNPISWAYWAYKFLTQSNQIAKIQISVEKCAVENVLEITVPRKNDRVYLWENGFFGKGSLSRTEATWFKRNTNTSNKVSLEEVTKKRRQQRITFKQARLKFEAKQLELRKEGIVNSDTLLLEEKEFLRELRDKELKFENETLKEENKEDSSKPVVTHDIEDFVLSPVEAFFLVYGLNVVNIPINDLMDIFTESLDVLEFIKQYSAYHHYRAHGWCVRDGVKFGCDYLIYKRGPPFSHAEFAIKVLDAEEIQDYTYYSSISRVIGGASKTLVLSYVSFTKSDEEIIDLWKKRHIKEIFQNCVQINEFVYKRWVPGRHRD